MTDEQEIARIMELRRQGLNAEQIGKKLFFRSVRKCEKPGFQNSITRCPENQCLK